MSCECTCVTGRWRNGKDGMFFVGTGTISEHDGSVLDVARLYFHTHDDMFGTIVTVDSSIDIDFCPFCGRKLGQRFDG